jgi:RHS repeat-associated protein
MRAGLLVAALVPSAVLALAGADRTPAQAPPPPPLEQSIGTCGIGIHAYSRSACRQGVNTLTGAYTTQTVDLRLPGIGIPFAWSRSYTSSDVQPSALGRGWTHSYDVSVSDPGQLRGRLADGDPVVVRGGDGQQVVYTRQGDSFTAPSGALSVLSAVPNGYQLLRPDQADYRFNDLGRLLSVKDRNGYGLTFEYDSLGQLETITDSVGREIAVQHLGGRLTRVTLPGGRFVEYGYTNGLLTSARDARGNTTAYVYDAAGRLERIVDQRQHTIVRNVYDQATERVKEQYDAFDHLTEFAWDPLTQTSTTTDARDHAWTDVYAGRLLAERRDPLGNRTLFEYDGDLNVTMIADARNNATEMEYDDRGNLEKRTAPPPLSYVEEWTYTPRNDPETYTDGRTHVTNFEYDLAGNLTKVIQPDADGVAPTNRPEWIYERDPVGTGLLKSLTDPRGKKTEFAYDDGNLVEIKTPLGHRTTLCYDGPGRMIGLVDPRGTQSCDLPNDHRWSYEYNNNDQLTKRTDPLGHETDFEYDPAGNLVTRTDANEHVTAWGYDDANRLETVTAPDPDAGGQLEAPITMYAYDAVGNLERRTVPNEYDAQTVYEYDDANRLRMTTNPLGDFWTYEHDPNGNLEVVVDANGNQSPEQGDGQTTYGYDELNRLESIEHSDSTTPDVTFEYDANDNRTLMADGQPTVETYDYDPLNRLRTIKRGSVTTISYGYDLLNLTQRNYQLAPAITYGYDDDERLQSVTVSGLTTSYGYDAAANVTRTTLPSGNDYSERRSYDPAGRLTTISVQRGLPAPGVLSSMTATLDAVGNPLEIVRSGSLVQTQTFDYDDMDRLTGVCFQAGDCPGANDPFIRWTYDGVGNRLSQQRPTSSTNYPHNAADALFLVDSSFYGVDANGNQTILGEPFYTYDLANRVKTATVGGTTTTYTYDGDGKRLQASTGSQPSQTTSFLWDPSFPVPQLALEQDGASALLRAYRYGHRRISMQSGATTSYYHHDFVGSVVDVTGGAGGLRWAWSYEPFGNTRTEQQGGGSQPTNPQRFAGEYRDPSALYHLRARQLDTPQGRFLSPDPAPPSLFEPYLSAYAYAANQPTLLTDPTGLSFIGDLGHGLLDVAGVVPVLGEPADLVNCAWYGAEGDQVNAALSCAAVVLGMAATTAKYGRKLDAAVDAAKSAPPTPVFRSFTRGNFRENLARRTGGTPANAEAHHVFPQQFARQFDQRGINIHDPRYGAWWAATSHRQASYAYNQQWREFLFRRGAPPTGEEIFGFGRQLSRDYGLTPGF